MSVLATRVAGAPLGEAERHALELRERTGAGYAEIASVVGVEPREVGALLSSARMSVREAVRGRPAPALDSADCARARPLLSARQDGERLEEEDRTFLRRHVEDCDSCRSARVALREGTLALRAALGVSPAPAAAVPLAEVAAPESELAETRAPAPPDAAPALPAAAIAPLAVPAPPPDAARAPRRAAREPAAQSAPRRRRRAPAVLAVAILASAVASMGTILLGGDEPRRSSAAQPAEPTASPTPTPAPNNDARRAAAARRRAAAEAKARRERAAARRRRAARASATATATPTPAPAAATATPQPTRTPKPESRRDKPDRQKPADDGAGTQDADTKTGSGGAVIPQQPTDNPDGKPDVIPDSCSQDNPDCDSG